MLAALTTAQKQVSRVPLLGIWLALVFLAVRVQSNQSFTLALPTKLQDFITLSLSIIIEALPFVVLGILLSIVVQVWIPEGFLFRILPKRALLRRVALSFLGMFLPVCECGNVPLARGLLTKGFSLGESLTFLLAAPILNPITIITTQQAFRSDNTILAARLIGGFLVANIIGWLFSAYSAKQSEALLTPEFAKSCEVARHHHPHSEGRLRQSLEVFAQEANNIMPALFIGGFIAGLVQVGLPRDVLLTLGGHVVWSVLAMMVLAFVISICANVDAFFSLAFANTFTTGALVSFLVFGPIIDIKMLNLMRTTYRARVILTITVCTTLISGALGLLVNYAF
jgi:uncharacterized membrane protein YraQ (UPF0718 family)